MTSEQNYKNKIALEFFDTKDLKYEIEINKIDLQVLQEDNEQLMLWCECKPHQTDNFSLLTQLLLTIKRNEKQNLYVDRPKFLGGLDNNKIFFVEYIHFQSFNPNDFN
jgi:hypothetical protein